MVLQMIEIVLKYGREQQRAQLAAQKEQMDAMLAIQREQMAVQREQMDAILSCVNAYATPNSNRLV